MRRYLYSYTECDEPRTLRSSWCQARLRNINCQRYIMIVNNMVVLTPKIFAKYTHHGESQLEVPSLGAAQSRGELPICLMHDGTYL